MPKKTKMFKILTVSGAMAFSIIAIAAQNQKLQNWQDYLNVYRSSLFTQAQSINESVLQSSPYTNGHLIVLAPKGSTSYTNVSKVFSELSVTTNITTNSSFSSNFDFNTYSTVNISSSFSNTSASDWITARADYLTNNFGIDPDAALSMAIDDVGACQAAGADCSGLGQITDYQLIPKDPVESHNVSVNNNTSTNTTGPVTTTSKNGNVTTVKNVTTTKVTNTTTTTTTDTLETGSIDITTQASNAPDGTAGDITQETQTQDHSDTDVATQTDTQTDETVTQKTETKKDTLVTNKVKKPKRWDLNIAPVIFFDFQHSKKITNLDKQLPLLSGSISSDNKEAKMRVEGKDVVTENVPVLQTPTLKFGQQKGPFRVKDSYDFKLGVGAAATWTMQNAKGFISHVSPYLAIVPMVGHPVSYERVVATMADAYKKPSLQLPAGAATLQSWSVGDKVSYATEGGIIVSGGVSVFTIGIGPSFTVSGSFSTTIQKIGEQKVLVRTGVSNLKSVAGSAGGLLASASAAYISTAKETAKTFLFDLSQKGGIEAYEKYVTGDFTLAQKLSRDDNDTSVVALDSTRSISSGWIKSLDLGLPPFIHLTLSKSDLHSATFTDVLADNTQIEANYGISLSKKEARFFNKESDTSFGFYAAAYDQKNADQSKVKGHFAQIIYSFSKTDANAQNIQNAINKLISKTGMKRELNVQFSKQDLDDNGARGAADVEFVLNFNPMTTSALISLGQDPKAMAVLEKEALALVDAEYAVANPEAYTSNSSSLDEIVQSIKKQTRAAFRDIAKESKTLAAVRNYQNAGERQQFADAYARAGRALISNAFVFQPVFARLKGFGVSGHYSVSGQNLAVYNVGFDWRLQNLQAQAK